MEALLKCLLGPGQKFLTDVYESVMSCDDNVHELVKEMGELRGMHKDLEAQVATAKMLGKKPMEQVEWWLESVGGLDSEATKVEVGFEKRFRCLGGVPPNVWASYHLSEQAKKMIKDAKDYKEKRKGFPTKVAEGESPPDRFVEKHVDSGSAQSSVLVRLLSYVRDENVSIIGIHGMGGVGKTELLAELNNELRDTDLDYVIWVDMPHDSNVDEVQKAVGQWLGLPWEENKTRAQRARLISRNLRNAKFVLICDGVWESLDYGEVGIPVPRCPSKCKIIIATRIESICDRMGAKKKVRVKCLGWEAAWSLFVDKAGEEHINSDARIRAHAKALAKKCGGLPLALVDVGLAMRSKKTRAQWQNAVTVLSIAPWQLLGTENLSLLKLSYDKLASDKLRTCLLYCSLYPEDFSIRKQSIIDYCIGEGIIDDIFNDIDEVYNKGHDLLGDLEAASLLESCDDENHIKMHPIIRGLALWVACDCGRNANKWLVRAGTGQKAAPVAVNWREAERISLMRNDITELSEIPECANLLTLMLQRNAKLKKIRDGFFQFMTQLRVLDLSHSSIEEIPGGIEMLGNLQYFDVCGTNIKSLPIEFGKLKKLRFLLLSFTPYLISIPDEVIACLTQLQVLYLESSYGEWKIGSLGSGVDFNELDRLKQLKALGITVETVMALYKLLASIRLATSTRRLHVRSCQGLTTISTTTIDSSISGLRWLRITDSSDLEEVVINGGHPDGVQSDEEGLLPNLETVQLVRLPKAKIIWNSGSLQSLSRLYIGCCPGMEQLFHCKDVVISEDDIDEAGLEAINAVPNLKVMQLAVLPELKSLRCGRKLLNFPSLEILEVLGCPKLKKLELVAENLKEIQGRRSWWEGLEWEDNQALLAPLFKEKKLH